MSAPHSSFIAHHKSAPLTDLAAALVLIFALLLCRSAALPSLDSEYLGGASGDPGLYIWLTKTVIRDLFSQGSFALPWFNTHAFYPYGLTLAWSDNYIFPALLVSGLSSLAHPLAYNLTLLFAQFLFGYITYRLVFSLSGNVLVSLFGGITALSSLYLTAHLGHPQLQWIFTLPATLLCVISFINQPRALPAISFGLLLTLSILCSVYHTILSAIGAALFYLLCVMMKHRQGTFKSLLKAAPWFIIGALPALPFLIPYLSIKDTFGTRELYEAFYLSADLRSYLSLSTLSPLSSFFGSAADEERNLFPGVVLCFGILASLWRILPPKRLRRESILCVAAFCALLFFSLYPSLAATPELTKTFRPLLTISLWLLILSYTYFLRGLAKLELKLGFNYITGRDLIGVSLWCALFFFALSLGPLANETKGESSFSLYTLLYSVLPGFDGLRAIARAGVYVHFFLILALSLTLGSIRRKKLKGAVCTACVAFTLCEYYPRFIPKEALPTTPLAYETVQSIAQGDTTHAIITLPLTPTLSSTGEVEHWSEYARTNTLAMNWGSDLPLYSVNGYTGIRSKLMRELPRELRNFPDPRSIAALRKIAALRYIVFIPSHTTQYSEDNFGMKLKPLTHELELRSIDPLGNLVLSLKGGKPLEAHSPLSIAPYKGGVVTLVLRAQKNPAILSLFEDTISTDKPFYQASFEALEQREITIPLSNSNNLVRPRSIRMESGPKEGIILIDSRYSIGTK